MSTIYYTPQRIITGHLTRYLRRAAASSGGGAPINLDVHSWFTPQLLSAGEREPLTAQFAAGTEFSAASADFTLWAAGSPVEGYNGVSASISPNCSSRLFTVSATIDLTADADIQLAGGIYEGEFLLTTSTGEIVAARGAVTILTPDAGEPPGDYLTGGGLA